MADRPPDVPLDNAPLPRSPLLLHRDRSAVLVVDVQQKLLPVIRGHERLVWNIRRLLDAARLWQVPCWATEQYPQRLGPTVDLLADRLQVVGDKLAFSCGGCQPLLQQLRPRQLDQILVVGIETHVCVQQTALDLLTEGYQVHVAADAVGTRFSIDHDWALRRMESSGVTITTVEAAMFEWCTEAGTDAFKQTSQLVRELAPSESTDTRDELGSPER
ncbi:MAG: isochorismatase family protein [Pirellulales bacterium]